MFIVDSHCHLDALDYENLHKDIADVVAKAQARDVKHLLAIGVTLSRFEKAYPELAKFPNVSLACGDKIRWRARAVWRAGAVVWRALGGHCRA